VAGLGFGAWRVLSRGPVPALGSFPDLLAHAVDAITVPARAAVPLGNRLRYPERAFDWMGRAIATAAVAAGRTLGASEARLNRTAQSAARATAAAAGMADAAETGGFAAGGERFAAALHRAGGGLRLVQSGRVYLYTLGLVAWILVAAAVFVVL
jgi:NADH-quinone oxidoreductase subunit L